MIRLAAGEAAGAWEALVRAVELNGKLKVQAAGDGDLEGLRSREGFEALVGR